MMVAGSVEEYTDCPDCSGAGFIASDPNKVCGRCMGLGAVRVKTPQLRA
jgi:DnaJ-class molecular chaperone